MKKEVKDTIISELGNLLAAYPHFYVVDVTGLDAKATSNLRRKAFQSGVKIMVVKNKLLIKALDAAELDYSPLYETLKGNTALMFTQTANLPAKLLKEYKDVNPTLKGAYAEESIFVGADKLAELAALKSRNELIADVIALLQSPAKNVVSALQSGSATIHGLLKTLGERPE